MRILLPLVIVVCSGCAQVRTGISAVDATSAVASGLYMQDKVNEKQRKSTTPDPFKKADPTVQKLDAAIEKARRE
jgi:uncharacterized protein YceK